MPNIERLHGDAPRLLWPARELAPIFADLAYVRAELVRDQSSGPATARAVTLATQATEAFARANAIRRRKASSWPWNLLGEMPSFWRNRGDVFSHCQLFLPACGGRTSLVVIHNRLPNFPLEIVSETWTVDRLPLSWHRDPLSFAYALRPAPAPAVTGSTSKENEDENDND